MIALYAGFLVGVVALLALDLGVLRRGTGEVGVRAALGWTAAWVAVALAFAGFLYAGYEHGWLGLGTTPDASSQARAVAGGAPIYNDGRDAVIKYLTGFAVEKALAMDNVFVIALIAFFRFPSGFVRFGMIFIGLLNRLFAARNELAHVKREKRR